MTRGLSTDNANAVAAPVVVPVFFVELDFESATIYAHSQVGTINWGGHDWLGVGILGSIGSVEEESDLARQTWMLTLSGIPLSMVAISLDENYQGRTAILYIGLLNQTTMQLVDTP